MANKKEKPVGAIVLVKDGNYVPYSDWDKAYADVQKGWGVAINKTGKKLLKESKAKAKKETKAKK